MATSNRSTTDYARSASTATTGTVCSRPAWSSVTSRPNTTNDTATRRWATARRSSTLRPAGAPTSRWPARSTESGSNNPTLKPGGLSNGDSPRRVKDKGFNEAITDQFVIFQPGVAASENSMNEDYGENTGVVCQNDRPRVDEESACTISFTARASEIP